MPKFRLPALAGLACLSVAHAGDLALSPAQVRALGVAVQTPQVLSAPRQTAWPARLTAAPGDERVISALYEGLVSRVRVVDGQAVRAGQPLLDLQAPALLEQQLAVVRAGSRAKLAADTLKRYRGLLAEGLIAGRKVTEAEADSLTADAELRTAEAGLRLAGMSEAQIARLRAGQSPATELTVTAPRDGRITGLKAAPGQRIEAAGELMRLVAGNALWVEAAVPVEAAAAFRPGQTVPVDSGRARARVISVGAVAGEAQSVTVRAALASPWPGALPGLATSIGAASGDGSAWQLPQTAVTRLNGRTVVFVQRASGFAPVDVQASGDGRTAAVRGALRADDPVAVSGVTALRNAWQAGN